MPAFALDARRTQLKIEGTSNVIDPAYLSTYPQPPSTSVDAGLVAWVRHAADSSAQMTEGDVLLEEETGLRLFVYQTAFDSTHVLASCLELSGETLTRTRYGEEDATIDPAWVHVLRAGAPNKIAGAFGAEIGISAEIRVKASADVQAGDFLYAMALGVRFLCYQIIPGRSQNIALVQQLPLFIPDDFNLQIIEDFWVQTPRAGSLSADEFGFLEIGMPEVDGDTFGEGARITQILTGDFDVYANLDTVSPLGTYHYITGLIAFEDGTHYCGAVRIGHNSNTPNTWITRVDKVGASYDGESEDSITTGKYHRIRRVGNVLTCFYSSASPPESESDWVVMGSTGDRFYSSAALEVGLCGAIYSGDPQTAQWDWIKPWVPS